MNEGGALEAGGEDASQADSAANDSGIVHDSGIAVQSDAADQDAAVDAAAVCAPTPPLQVFDEAGACGYSQYFPCGLGDASTSPVAPIGCRLLLGSCAHYCTQGMFTDCVVEECALDGSVDLTRPVTLVCDTRAGSDCKL